MSSVAKQMVKGPVENSSLGKYRISQPGDTLELEADRVADEVLRMPGAVGASFATDGPPLQRKCAACEAGDVPCPACSLGGGPKLPHSSFGRLLRRPITNGEQRSQSQRQGRASLGSGVGDWVGAVEKVRSGGTPLPKTERAYFEPRFRTDLSRVRVHTGEAAARATSAVNASAFTLGHAIAVAPGQYDTNSLWGRRLLAHELTHVMQQNGGITRLADAKVTEASADARSGRSEPISEKIGIPFTESRDRPISGHTTSDPTQNVVQRSVLSHGAEEDIVITEEGMATGTAYGYWYKKIEEQYEPMIDDIRDMSGPEAKKRDAILSSIVRKLPDSPPKPGADKQTFIVSIAGLADVSDLTVYVRLVPKSLEEDIEDKRTQLYAEIISEGAASAPEKAPKTKKDERVPKPEFPSIRNVPNDDGFKFSQDYKEELNQVYKWWQEQDISDNFTRTIETNAARGKTLFMVKGIFEFGSLSSFQIYFLGENTHNATPPPDFDKKSAAGFELEKLKSDPRDRIGTITHTATPDAERPSTEYVTLEYFEKGNRSTEIDVIIPIAGTENWINYTLIFDTSEASGVKTTNISISRVGLGTKPSDDTPEASLDIRNVNGFPKAETNKDVLTTWIKNRYKSMSLDGTTVDEVIASANSELAAGAGTTSWFTENYSIEILSGIVGKETLERSHGFSTTQAAGTKDYESGELTQFEQSLQQISSAVLTQFEQLKMIRQDTNKKIKGDGDTSGMALPTRGKEAIIMFDNAFNRPTFIGGASGVFDDSISTFTHELAHIAEKKIPQLKTDFNTFVKMERIDPFTAYSRKKPSEFFAEAYSLFYSDPEWMKTNHPKVHAWFVNYISSGKVPTK